MLTLGQKVEMRQAIKAFSDQSDSLRAVFDKLDKDSKEKRLRELSVLETDMMVLYENLKGSMNSEEKKKYYDDMVKAGEEKEVRELREPDLFDGIEPVPRDEPYEPGVEPEEPDMVPMEDPKKEKLTGCLGQSIQENLKLEEKP